MKTRRIAAALLVLLTLSVLAGCAAPAAETALVNWLPVPEFKTEAPAEPAPAEKAAHPAPEKPAPAPETGERAMTIPPETAPPTAREETSRLTEEEAAAIALNHAGLAQTEVTHLRTRYDRDDRVPEYEVEFCQGRWEYEYEIHAETGVILSWEKDD